MVALAKFATTLAGVAFGAGAFPLYALAVAHANDYADASECVEISSGLLLIYGLGAAAGPLLASFWRELSTGPTLFYFTAVVHVGFIGYVAWRITRRNAAPAADGAAFSGVALAAQTVMPFDPIGTGPRPEEAEGHA